MWKLFGGLETSINYIRKKGAGVTRSRVQYCRGETPVKREEGSEILENAVHERSLTAFYRVPIRKCLF